MRLATWNINGLRARLEFVLHWLRARQPDLVGLQELKMEEERLPREAFAAEGYHLVAHSQKAWNGVAILSRKPLETRQSGLPGAGSSGARLIEAAIGKLVFVTVYCPNGKSLGHPDFGAKLLWFDRLLEYLREAHCPDQWLILGGDFNICHQGLDSWNEQGLAGKIFHTDEERIRLGRLLQWGLKDLYRERHPQGTDFSWWDYRAGAFHRNWGLRIDYLLATPTLLERVTQVAIDRDYRKKKEGMTASDHAPVMAVLDL